ncbi:MAG: DNA translocase FtsK [Firmicutes bacterium]|nr:DNA translocase FtsK [Bacillota bacterium]
MSQAKKKKTDPSQSKARQKAKEIQEKRKADKRVIDEIWAIITIAIGIFFAVSILTTGAGKLGEVLKSGMMGLFGHIAYAIPFILIIFGILLFAKRTSHFNLKTLLLLIFMLLMICTLWSTIRFIAPNSIPFSWGIKEFFESGKLLQSGGLFGMLIGTAIVKWLGNLGCYIFTGAAILICLLLIINTPISRGLQTISEKMEERRLIKEHAHLDDEYEQEVTPKVATDPWPVVKKPSKEDIPKKADNKTSQLPGVSSGKEEKYIPISTAVNPDYKKEQKMDSVLQYMNDDSLFGRTESGTIGLEESEGPSMGYGLDGEASSDDKGSKSININTYSNSRSAGKETADKSVKPDDPDKAVVKKLSDKEAGEAMISASEINKAKVLKKYKMPPINLLERPSASNKESTGSLQAKAIKLEDTLRSFNVDASVIQVTQGPTVTRYEIQPAVGVKVAKIVNLADDIALNLRARSIRIEAPIPGKAAIGVEIENERSTPVALREIIDSDNFRSAKSKITFAVGKDISGEAIVANLKDMPHMLIAGSTGSGKSVCINSILVSLLYKANPDEVKLILIDPKVVELSNYNGIPHLLIPVVTDPTKAAAALNWAVAEMEERYNKFHIEGAKDLASYNDLVKMNDEPDKVLPQIVIVIDELADLMMAASSQVQDSICRIAQKARAAGMHLIVATQRPSVDVITGVIKANIPSRIAFAVSSHVDSQTILDEKGAEKLVGKGDMLFRPMGQGEPTRIQGCFVSDREVNAVIDYVKSQVEGFNDPKQQEIMARIERSDTNGSSSKDQNSMGDELLMDSIELVIDSGKASVSMLQRRFRIGYNRAARIVDMMEEMGVVGPQDGSSPRQVIMTRAEFEALQKAQAEEEQETFF